MLCESDLRCRLPLCALALCLSSGCDRSSGYATSQPSKVVTEAAEALPVVCREAIWDFGTVDNTKTRERSHRFAVENVSDASVQVEKVESECGCVVASDHPREIPSQAAADFPIVVNLAGPPRPLRKRVTIHLATSPPSQLALTVRGTIDASPTFYSVPGTVDFGTLGTSEKRSRVVKIVRYDTSAVRFVRGVTPSDAVSLDGSASADDRDSVVELTLSLDASRLRSGGFASFFLVQTDHPTYPEFEVPLKATIAGESSGLVRSIFARKLRPGTSQDLPLTSEAPSADVEAVSYEGPAPVAVELVQDEGDQEGAQPTVRIARNTELSQGAASKVVSGHLLVTLSGRDSPVRIPMFVQLTD